MSRAVNPVPLWYLHQCFRVDADSGRIYWRARPRWHFATDAAATNSAARAGTIADADTFRQNGYRRVRVSFDGRCYGLVAHRVVYALFHGAWPALEIDHINRNRVDNRLVNLRVVTHIENTRNRRAPRPGRAWRGTGDARGWTFRAGRHKPFQVTCARRFVGSYVTEAEATAAYRAAIAERAS